MPVKKTVTLCSREKGRAIHVCVHHKLIMENKIEKILTYIYNFYNFKKTPFMSLFEKISFMLKSKTSLQASQTGSLSRSLLATNKLFHKLEDNYSFIYFSLPRNAAASPG